MTTHTKYAHKIFYLKINTFTLDIIGLNIFPLYENDYRQQTEL